MAFTGFMRDAIQAGTKPETNPMVTEMVTPRRMFPIVSVKGVSKATRSQVTIRKISDDNFTAHESDLCKKIGVFRNHPIILFESFEPRKNGLSE